MITNLAFVAFGMLSSFQSASARTEPQITHGVASGDVTPSSAVIWARADKVAEMRVEVDTDPGFSDPRIATASNSVESDFTAQVEVTDLQPATGYAFRVRFVDSSGNASRFEEGSFHTAPESDSHSPVSFVMVGDLAGQSYCRPVEGGYEFYARMEELSPDFWIANGDMIYADYECPGDGPHGWKNVPGDFPPVTAPGVNWKNKVQVQEVIWRHWRYNRADMHSQSFHAKVPMVAQWDDHEVINDFGARWPIWLTATEREGFPNLVEAGRDALFHYSPMERHSTEPDRIYRSFRWGADLELFMLDARSYRSFNDLADHAGNEKTLLGREQIEWLKRGLTESTATWKVVSSDVPLSVPTGSNAHLYGRDAWANGLAPDYSSQTGFERELMDLMTYLDTENIRNLVFLATDVHFAMSIRYRIDADGDGDLLIFHEFLSGPVNAGCSPTPAQLDPTLGPIILYGEGNLFNFCTVRIERRDDGLVHFSYDVRGVDGQPRFGSQLDLVSQ
jgi:alkaline phosphatase D